MQVEARMNQDQNISKDLTLWNQQGSQVLRGQMQVLPIDNTFLYVEPIYIQAKEARMPQMKKVVLGVGNTLIYTDNYQEALGTTGRNVGRATAADRGSSPARRRLRSAANAAARAPTSGSTASAIICAATGISPRRAGGRKRARNSRRSNRWRKSRSGHPNLISGQGMN